MVQERLRFYCSDFMARVESGPGLWALGLASRPLHSGAGLECGVEMQEHCKGPAQTGVPPYCRKAHRKSL